MKTIFILSALFLLTTANAEDRSKSLKFEDEVIEGINKQSMDSLTQLSEDDDRKRRGHLYEKRTNFKVENQETMRELTGVK